jgi:hypothetical protein
MNDNVLLIAAYALIGPAWLALMVAPRWSMTRVLCRTSGVSLLLAVSYFVLFLLNLGDTPGASVWTMEGLVTLFSFRSVVLIGWIHYLAFDLFVGSWIASDAARLDIHPLAVFPCLLFVLMMGPIGLLMYFGLRLVLRRGWTVFDPVGRQLLEEVSSTPSVAGYQRRRVAGGQNRAV